MERCFSAICYNSDPRGVCIVCCVGCSYWQHIGWNVARSNVHLSYFFVSHTQNLISRWCSGSDRNMITGARLGVFFEFNRVKIERTAERTSFHSCLRFLLSSKLLGLENVRAILNYVLHFVFCTDTMLQRIQLDKFLEQLKRSDRQWRIFGTSC